MLTMATQKLASAALVAAIIAMAGLFWTFSSERATCWIGYRSAMGAECR